MSDPIKPSPTGRDTDTDEPHAQEGTATARRPNDKLDQDRDSTETIPRKSSLL